MQKLFYFQQNVNNSYNLLNGTAIPKGFLIIFSIGSFLNWQNNLMGMSAVKNWLTNTKINDDILIMEAQRKLY